MCSVCCVQSAAWNHKKSSVQDKSYWKIVLTASDTPQSVWEDINYFGHWNKHCFFSLCNIICYSQHIINLKSCLNSWRCAFALHQKRFLIPKHSTLLLPCQKEKVDRTAFSLPSFSLSSQLFHINLKANDLFLFSPLLSSICFHSGLYLVPEWHKKPYDGEGNRAVGLPQTKSWVYSHQWCRVLAPHVLQKEISFGIGNATVVSKYCCRGAGKLCSLRQGFLSHGFAFSLTPTIVSVWVPTRLPLKGISNVGIPIFVGMQVS